MGKEHLVREALGAHRATSPMQPAPHNPSPTQPAPRNQPRRHPAPQQHTRSRASPPPSFHPDTLAGPRQQRHSSTAEHRTRPLCTDVLAAHTGHPA
eukprot:281348-Chlamydomonas_euryale.AAC.1